MSRIGKLALVSALALVCVPLGSRGAELQLTAADVHEETIDGRQCLVVEKALGGWDGGGEIAYCFAVLPLVVEGVPDSLYGCLRFDVIPLWARAVEGKLDHRIGAYAAEVAEPLHLDLTGAVSVDGDTMRVAAFLGDFESSAQGMRIRFDTSKASGSGQVHVVRRGAAPQGNRGGSGPRGADGAREATETGDAIVAYPNPFNPVVRIAMREGGRDCASGRVAIYDARGRKVREISGSVFSRDGVTWRGETDDGTSVAAGVYVWVQTCYDRREPSRPCTGKITLLR